MHMEENQTGSLIIEDYQSGSIIINGTHYAHSVILGQDNILPLTVASPHDLTVDDFQLAYDAGANVVLLGTGKQHHFLHPKITAVWAAKGLGIESMNTAAACRTFMMLQSEGRSVWAWLFI